MELTASEGVGLKRMDVKEANPYLRSLSHFPPQAALRYHRQPNETPNLTLEWVRFPDSSVLAAVAENAVVTTLVTSEGKSLAEVRLTIKNQAQPFLKVALPPGASILSADVAGEKVKPVESAATNGVVRLLSHLSVDRFLSNDVLPQVIVVGRRFHQQSIGGPSNWGSYAKISFTFSRTC